MPHKHETALENYLTADVIAVAYFDLTKINPPAVVQQLQQLGIFEDVEFAQVAAGAEHANSQLERLRKSGVENVYVLVRVSDLGDAGPAMVMPLAPGTDVEKTATAVREVLGSMPEPYQNLKIETGIDAVFATTSESQMTRMLDAGDKTDEANAIRELSGAWQAIGAGSAGLLVFGDADSRKVVRGLLPKLPPPFETLTGPLVADHLKWAGIQVNLPPDLKVKMEFETDDEQASEVFNAAINNGLKVLGGVPQFQSLLPAAERDLVLKALQPVKQGTRTSVSLDAVTGDFDRVSQILVPQMLKVREAARQSQEMNNLRQLALGLLNYESAFQHFPRRREIRKTTCRTELRVHILPFMEQNELYKQFHLDEPWDSDHNLPLVKQMPQIYQSPMGINREGNLQGKTVYQVPICPESIFQPDADTAGFRDIKDGSSNTILIVVVAPDQAAIWTKPDDWEVDLDNPLAGLTGNNRESLAVVFCDGSTHRIPLTIKRETLRALVTRSGGEVVTLDE